MCICLICGYDKRRFWREGEKRSHPFLPHLFYDTINYSMIEITYFNVTYQ